MLTLKITVVIFSLMTRRASLGNTLGFRTQHLLGAWHQPRGEDGHWDPAIAVTGWPVRARVTNGSWTAAQVQHTPLTPSGTLIFGIPSSIRFVLSYTKMSNTVSFLDPFITEMLPEVRQREPEVLGHMTASIQTQDRRPPRRSWAPRHGKVLWTWRVLKIAIALRCKLPLPLL